MPSSRRERPLRVVAVLSCAFMARPVFSAQGLAPGLTYSNEDGYHVVTADLDSKTLEVRVARPDPDPKKNKRTVAQHAKDEGALVAVNANFFGGPDNHPCGAARGYGVQYPGIYGEAPNCETTLGWSRGKGGLFRSAGNESNPNLMPRFTELVTGGGMLLFGGRRVEWNKKKLARGRPCTAAGLSEDRKKIVLVAAGVRVCTGEGLQKVLLAAGAYDAVHLDGGGSSKMWLKGRGYVNAKGGDRAPPVVIVIKSGAEKKPPARCPSGNGLYCGGNPIPGDPGVLYRCTNGLVTVERRCAQSCVRMPPGKNDKCR